jgi:hypothetical protein
LALNGFMGVGTGRAGMDKNTGSVKNSLPIKELT